MEESEMALLTDEEQAAEIIKWNITYDLAGKNPIEAAKAVKKTLKEVLRSGEIDGVTAPNKAVIEAAFVGEKWELELETGREGIDCPVILHVCGVKDDEDPITLNEERLKDDDSNNNSQVFQPGQTDIFEILVDDAIGDIFKLRFGFSPDVTNAKWHLKSLKLRHPKNKDMFKTECNLEVAVSPYVDCWREVFVIWPDYPALPVISYIVNVFTSPTSGLMDCGVDLILEGDHGTSGRRTLKKLTGNKKKFKPGQMDVFEVPVVKLGRVLRCHVFNDLTSPNRTWLLDKIIVKDSEQQADEDAWNFPCKRYFDPEKGDFKTDRILHVGKQPEPEPQPLLPPPPPASAVANKKVWPKLTPKVAPTKPPVAMKDTATAVTPIPTTVQRDAATSAIANINEDQWEIFWENRKSQLMIKDVPVTFIIVGDKGESDEIAMVVQLKPGVSPRRIILADPTAIGDLLKVRIRFGDQVKNGAKWDIAKLHVKHLASDETSTFEFERAIVQKTAGDSTAEASNGGVVPVRTYVCELYNGNRTGLLEKGRVYVMLRGRLGTTGKRWIVNAAEGHLPLKGKQQVIIYELQCVDLGDIRGIRFGHDRRGRDASYFLEKIIVRPTHLADLQYVFEFAPLQKDQGTQASVVEVPAVVETSIPATFDEKKPDSHEWFLWWTSEPDQTFDFLQIAMTMVGAKGRSDYLIDVEIGPGDSSTYKIKLDEEIGELKSVHMKHGPKVQGKHPPWRVVEMRLQNRATGQLFKFKPPTMAVKSPSPPPIEPVVTQQPPRQPTPAAEEAPRFRYRVEVFTSQTSTPSTQQPEMYIKFIGEYFTSEPFWFSQSMTNAVAFRPGQLDAFEMALDDDLGAIEAVRLGLGRRKATSVGPGISGIVVDKVVVKPQHTPNKTYTFNTGVDSISQREAVEWLISWVCADSQANLRATVSLVLYGGGRKRSSEVTATTLLRPGPSEEYRCEFNDRADDDADFLPYKVRVGFISTADQQAMSLPHLRWDIVYVRLRCSETQKVFTFTLTKKQSAVILSEDKDGWREIPVDVAPNQKGPSIIDYQLDIFTSQEIRFALDSKVSVNIKGRRGDCGFRTLKRSLNNAFQNFQPGRMDTFRVEAVDLGEIRSLIIGHDETGRNQSWHCDRVNLLNRRTGELYEFVVRGWFDRKMGEGTVQRRLRPYGVAAPPPASRRWFVSIAVANLPNAGTAAPLGIVICGRNNSSSIKYLTIADGFAPGEVSEFTINVELDDLEATIGQVFKIRLGFADWSTKPAVLIDHVLLKEVATGAQYRATVRQWIWATAKHDSWREFHAERDATVPPTPKLDVVKYQITTWTGEEMQADTDCDVYFEIEGNYGTTGKRRLASSLSHVNAFASGQMDLFDLEAVDVGEIQQIAISLAPQVDTDRNNWHLIRVLILKHPVNAVEEYVFECDHWFDNAAHSKSFPTTTHQRRAPLPAIGPEINYLVLVSTGPERDMAKSANVVLEIFGDSGMFGPFLLNRPAQQMGAASDQAFQPGLVDAFPIGIDESAVGRLLKVRLQNVGANPSWFVDKLSLYDLKRPRAETHHFDVYDWLAWDYGDGDSVKEFAVEQIGLPSLPAEYYSVEIENGQDGTPLTQAQFNGVGVTCYIEIFGATPLTSGIRPLRKNMDRNPLHQPGVVNVFTFSCVGVGDIRRIKIGHTAVDATFRWHVVRVTITWGNGKQRIFPCDMILARMPDDADNNIPVEIELGDGNN